MNRPIRFCIAGALALLLTGVWAPSAVAQGEGVGTVVAVEGQLDYSRGGPWFAGYRDLRTLLNDQLRTGQESVATLEFDIGGRVGLKPGTIVEVVGEREVAEVGGGLGRLILRTGGIWARVTKRKKPLQVQTSGGVMGIKGTEFAVEQNEDETVLAVFEGEVEVTTNDGQVIPAPAGTKITILKDVPTVKTYEDPDELKREFNEAWGDFNMIAGPALYATGGGGHLYYANMAVGVVNDPAQAAADYAASQVSSHVPVVGGFLGGMVSSAPRSGGESKPDFPVGLSPDQSGLGSSRPSFSWSAMEDVAEYVVLLGRDEEMDALVWTGTTRATSLEYPANGRPLEAGRYYWRVIALDDEGQPKGKASQTWFDTSGWSAPQYEQAAEDGSAEASEPAASDG